MRRTTQRIEMSKAEKEREAIAEARSEARIRLIPDGPGKWKLNIEAAEGLQIEPGDMVEIDNVLLDELMISSPNTTLMPVKFEADKSSMTKKAAKAK